MLLNATGATLREQSCSCRSCSVRMEECKPRISFSIASSAFKLALQAPEIYNKITSSLIKDLVN